MFHRGRGDGATVNEGRVEICLGGEWGTVCDHNWGAAEARVDCSQRGLTAERFLGHDDIRSNCLYTQVGNFQILVV